MAHHFVVFVGFALIRMNSCTVTFLWCSTPFSRFPHSLLFPRETTNPCIFCWACSPARTLRVLKLFLGEGRNVSILPPPLQRASSASSIWRPRLHAAMRSRFRTQAAGIWQMIPDLRWRRYLACFFVGRLWRFALTSCRIGWWCHAINYDSRIYGWPCFQGCVCVCVCL